MKLSVFVLSLFVMALSAPPVWSAPPDDWQALANIYQSQRDQAAALAQNAIAEAQVERGQIEAAQKVAKATADYWARYMKGLKPAALPSQGNHLGGNAPAKPN